jgi:DNA-binding beta-propeller fold protein YncE
VSSDGTHVWVVNTNPNDDGPYTVTEMAASTGGVQVLSTSDYGFNESVAVSSDGGDVWVANLDDNTLTGFPTS